MPYEESNKIKEWFTVYANERNINTDNAEEVLLFSSRMCSFPYVDFIILKYEDYFLMIIHGLK